VLSCARLVLTISNQINAGVTICWLPHQRYFLWKVPRYRQRIDLHN